MTDRNRINPPTRGKWGPYLLLGLLFCLLLYRCCFSFCQSDESFYAALAHRLWLGDRLVTEEWHPTQFYAVLLLPFQALYRLVVRSNDGILLYYRIVYTVLSFGVSLFAYRELSERYGAWESFFPASLFLVYSRANISGVSYYNLCLLMVLLAILCGFRAQRGRKPALFGVAAGAAAGLAVLCNPYTAVPTLFVLGVWVFRGKKYRLCLYAVLGLGGAAFLFLLFLLRAPLGELLSGLRFVLSDPQHDQDWSAYLLKTAKQMLQAVRYVLLPTALYSAYILWGRLGRRCSAGARMVRAVYIGISAVLLAYTAVRIYEGVVALILLPLTAVTLPFLLGRAGEARLRPAVWMYVGGLVLAVCFLLASNTGVDAMTVGFCLSAAGGLLLLAEAAGAGTEASAKKSRSAALLWGVTFALLLAQRVGGVYRDASITELTACLDAGPAKGLYTTQEHGERYNGELAVIARQAERLDLPGTLVLHSKWLPWAYLCCDTHYGAPTAWNTNDARLDAYYRVHPEMLPDIVFVWAPETGAWEKALLNNHVGQEFPNANEREGEFWTLVRERYDLLERTDWAEVYVRSG